MLYGEPFDTRLMILIHEHWWRWFSGKTTFRNMEFFYPITNSFGYSDTFLVQGLIHSFFRLLNVPMVQAWLITTFLCLLFGMIGWAYLATKITKNLALQILFILSIGLSYSFTLHFSMAPNFVGYTWISWILILFVNATSPALTGKETNLVVIFSIVAFLVLALSAWYVAFFIFLLTCFFVLIKALLKDIKYSKIWKFITVDIIYRYWILISPLIVILVFVFGYVYLSVFRDPSRPVNEMLRNSYALVSIIDGSGYGGGFFSPLYSFLKLSSREDVTIGIGFGLSLATLVLILIFLNSRWRTKILKSPQGLNTLVLFLSGIMVLFFFLKVNADFSLHKVFYSTIPGFNTIRSPDRYLAIFTYIVIFTFFRVCGVFIGRTRNKKSVTILLSILIILIIDQFRVIPDNSWKEDLLYDSKINLQGQEIKTNCDYFVYDAPGGWWSDQIKGMVFAYQLDVPTVNGYSGAFPPGYPTEDWLHEGDITGVLKWIKKIDNSKRGCFTTGESPLFYLNSPTVRFEFEDGFTPKETNGRSTWIWANRNRGFALVYAGKKTTINLSFLARTAPCLDSEKFIIRKLPHQVLYTGIITNQSKEFSLKLDVSEYELAKLEFITEDNFCKVENDPRQLFYEIKNWKVSSY
jgi:hypothetical protein